MEWRIISLLATMVVVAVAAPPSGDICKMCTCRKETIACDCTNSNKGRDVIVGPEYFEDSSELLKFSVQGCQSLTFLRNAFSKALKLQTLSVSKVTNVSFEMGVFHTLDSLLIDSVDSLILKRSAFQGTKSVGNIVIRDSGVPLIPKWALYNMSELKELRIEGTRIGTVETDAVFINMNHTGSNVVIDRSILGRIEEKGIQIGNARNLTMNRCLIKEAQSNSIRLSSRYSMALTENEVEENVDVDSLVLLYNGSFLFTNNILKNIGINITEEANTFATQTAFTLQRIVYENDGNQIPCVCSEHARNKTVRFFDNLCINGCQEASLNTFLDNCQESQNLSTSEILEKICKGRPPLPTPFIPSASPIVSSTPKPSMRSSATKVTAYLMQFWVLIFYLFK